MLYQLGTFSVNVEQKFRVCSRCLMWLIIVILTGFRAIRHTYIARTESRLFVRFRISLKVRLFVNSRDYLQCEVCVNGGWESIRFFLFYIPSCKARAPYFLSAPVSMCCNDYCVTMNHSLLMNDSLWRNYCNTLRITRRSAQLRCAQP